MKYVMMSVTAGRGEIGAVEIHVPIIFPNALVHKDIAHAMQRVLARQYRDPHVKPISAGKYDIFTQQCSGESETLGLKHRYEDSRTIQTYAYCHGIQ